MDYFKISKLFSSIQFNSIQFNSIQFNSIQFNSIQFNLFSIKQQTHLKHIQDEEDATKSESLKNVTLTLQLKQQRQTNKAKIIQKQAKSLTSMYKGMIHHWQLNYIWWFVLTIWKVRKQFSLQTAKVLQGYSFKSDAIFLYHTTQIASYICLICNGRFQNKMAGWQAVLSGSGWFPLF